MKKGKNTKKIMVISVVILFSMLVLSQAVSANVAKKPTHTTGKIQWIHWKTGAGDPYIDQFSVNDIKIHASRCWTKILDRLFRDRDVAEFGYKSYVFGYKLTSITEFKNDLTSNNNHVYGE